MKTKWMRIKQGLPTEADADPFGDIFWSLSCGGIIRIALVDFLQKEANGLVDPQGYWARTCFKYPVGPNLQ